MWCFCRSSAAGFAVQDGSLWCLRCQGNTGGHDRDLVHPSRVSSCAGGLSTQSCLAVLSFLVCCGCSASVQLFNTGNYGNNNLGKVKLGELGDDCGFWH